MSWKLLTFSVFFTDIFLLVLMFYLGYDFETFKKVALFESLLVAVAIIFDALEKKKKPIFPGSIVYPLLGLLFILGFTPILDFFAERPKGFHSWDIKNILMMSANSENYQFNKLAWYGKAYVQLGFAMVGGILGFIFHLVFRNS
ncbi:hypothetical protein ABLB96_09860 [Acinetobacter sp. XH1741]|uniref:hypothetical protein n=1 Tax=unclassified Acinetobacter TaxID=196816 RepID=UPI0032B39C6C